MGSSMWTRARNTMRPDIASSRSVPLPRKRKSLEFNWLFQSLHDARVSGESVNSRHTIRNVARGSVDQEPFWIGSATNATAFPSVVIATTVRGERIGCRSMPLCAMHSDVAAHRSAGWKLPLLVATARARPDACSACPFPENREFDLRDGRSCNLGSVCGDAVRLAR
jgi:hypothetical protein